MSETSVLQHRLSSDLRDSFTEILADFETQHAIFRLWAKDATLFTGGDESLMLDWLDEPLLLKKSLSALKEIKKNVLVHNFSSILLLGMGGSSLSVKMFQSIFASDTSKTFFVVDTIHPETLARLEHKIDLLKTLFIVASKSGTTLEPEILYHYFSSKLEENNVPHRNIHFMAITDPNTKLFNEALTEDFLPGPVGKTGIGGRYAGLSVFGILPAMLMNVDVEPLLVRAFAMAQDCGPSIAPQNNPAAILAAFIAAGIKIDKDQLVLHLSSTFKDFGLWLEQLIAESLGKNEVGLVPIIDHGDSVFNDDVSIHLVIQYGADQKIACNYADVFYMEVDDIYEISALMFRFQLAIALVAHVLKVNPFNQPDVEKSKLRAKEIIDQLKAGKKILEEHAITEAGISFFGDVKIFFLNIKRGDYCALLSYLDDSSENFLALTKLSSVINKKFSVNVMIEIGPRYLHSTGQLFKGGKNNGHFLVITGAYREDRISSYASLPFSDLHRSQALGDILAMKENGRAVFHVDIGDQRLEEFTKIISEI